MPITTGGEVGSVPEIIDRRSGAYHGLPNARANRATDNWSGLVSINSKSPSGPRQPGNELVAALRACRRAILALAIASILINVLYLTGSFYMLEVYDRVLTSRSVSTLVGLTVLALGLYVFQGVLDLLRGRILVRIGRSLGQNLSARVFDTIGRMALMTRGAGDGLQPLRDLDQVRNFLSSPGPLALLDLPWMPFYIAICFMFHVWIGVAALVGAICLVVFTVLTEVFTREPTKAATEASRTKRNGFAEASRRNAEVLQAMGMAPRFAAVWDEVNVKYLDSQQRASDVGGGFGAMSKVMRMVLQSAVLGVGAYLVILQEATAGIIIAGSILSARALAPVDLAIANWRSFVAFRQSWRRLTDLLAQIPATQEQMELPKPVTTLTVEGVSIVPPGDRKVVVQDVAFRLEKGNGLGIIGPSASGKSSLVRAIVGVWRPVRGTIRLDGAALDQWSAYVARAAHRLPAAGRRTVRRHGGAEHRALHRRSRSGRCDRGRQGGRRARSHPAPAGRLRDRDRRKRDAACRPDSGNESRWRARSMAIRSWSCSTSRTRISIRRARKP